MNIQDIQQLYGASPQAGALRKALEDKSVKTVFLQGLMASAAPMLFAGMAGQLSKTILFILQDADEAGYFYHDLTQALGNQQVLYFPSSYRRAVKYGQRDAANEILRTEVLAKLAAGKPLYIVASPESLCELVVSKQKLDEGTIKLNVGQTVDLMQLKKNLLTFGFQEVDYVYEPGQFAVRGSIVDVYSFSSEWPLRIDFFGDEIDTIRTFDVQDQLSKDKQTAIEIVPQLATADSEKVPFLHFLPADALLVMKDFTYVHDIIDHVYNEGFASQVVQERMEGATEVEQQEIIRTLRREQQLITARQFAQDVAGFQCIQFGTQPSITPQATITFSITPQPLFHKNFDLLRQTFEDYALQGYDLYIFAESKKQVERLREILGATPDAVLRDDNAAPRTSSRLHEPLSLKGTGDASLHEGFVDNNLRICCFTDHQIFERFHKYNLKSDKARSGKMALTLKELQEMEPGDFIVHVDFGIGKFGGLVRVPTGDTYQEMIRIIYQRGDIVDVSIHSLYKISKYRRSDTGEPPRLSTLGTGAWERLKEKTKKRIKDIARDLIKLYAKRRHEKGFSFSADNYMQQELEASFLYEDTPDQVKATAEVKADMEKARPMDRLVCGDVGFGKTEVAIRAAFKAACDSKQVAVLVPTTVLAFQHYKTFQERLRGMPVRVDYLSRARTAKQTRQVLDDLAAGRIDIIIGTHKLIGKSVKWHDLGLLIIDEEQKFGVSTKEKLRKLKTNVDTLTMSATPIPRTLQFSLMGARDMSVMRTPPPNRYPIHTEIGVYGNEIIADAINFEMSRNGQVYFVNDRISTLSEIEKMILKYVPDCRVAIGHGQMPPEQLENILIGFMNHDYDVLLSTSIIENGIDISNANTIIINNAHRVGLSDLHQMRGRVGRSNRKAFCYLLAPPKSVLTPEARRRLEALETFSELGSGFNIAMQDLDIRGAGNLLGAEQSGFMEDLGYETYQKILSQAVTELRNDEFSDLYEESIASGEVVSGADFVDDCAVESDLEMYFPDSYVPGSSERMLLYRELDNIEDDNELAAYRQRLIDRFGPIPHEGEELMNVVALRRVGKRLGCEKLMLKQGRMTMQFVSNPMSAYYKSKAFDSVLNYIGRHPRRCDLKEVKGRRMMHVSDVGSANEGLSILREIDGMA
ncbi:transcription-repair coupling factor [Hoylesella buccalis]|uniref:transcription-repair coupling factor n=1 Tax=Hoylesella buccalis TaxID=28127 RepID=UPI001D136083|nr:transcription-repair coupling factor [Hoylesella buccalis]UEA63340.1 transcription-repair coupling factor [Hoylesella buccalis]UWP49369.1 transcription-repair coupling factor [Hoylesella buccalis ATCC 35310]